MSHPMTTLTAVKPHHVATLITAKSYRLSKSYTTPSKRTLHADTVGFLILSLFFFGALGGTFFVLWRPLIQLWTP